MAIAFLGEDLPIQIKPTRGVMAEPSTLVAGVGTSAAADLRRVASVGGAAMDSPLEPGPTCRVGQAIGGPSPEGSGATGLFADR